MAYPNCSRPAFEQTMLRWLIFLAGILLAVTASLSRAADTADAPVFKDEELDQMLAPIALYPDSLLAQVLMAATYPADVAEAATWVKANPKQEGDAAIKAVQSKDWDPSVQSLVAFPQVLTMMGEKPNDVQRLGDAFLAEPSRVMDRVQFMRAKAKEAGNLSSNEQQNVSSQTDNGKSVIIIEPAQPEKVYVPVSQPTVVYGSWWYPSYPPYYWPPPAYYYPRYYGGGGAFVAGVFWGAAIVGISNGLWGGCNWGRGDVDINVNRYNNININNKITNIDRSRNSTSWKHNSANRKAVPYRDAKTRQQFDRKAGGAENRGDFRGRDTQRDANRERAQSTLKDRGIDPAQGRDKLRKDPQTRDRASAATRDTGRGQDRSQINRGQADRGQAGRGQMDRSSQDRARAQNVDRSKSRASNQSLGGGNNAFSGAGNASHSRDSANRGTSSRQSAGNFGGASSRSHSGGGRSYSGGGGGGGRSFGGGGGGRGGGGRGR